MTEPRIEFYPEKHVDGVKGWHWIETDSGAWVGPRNDWRDHHKRLVLEEGMAGRPRRVCVQAGGCQGMYPRLLSPWFETVHTFEPDSLNFQALQLNCAAVDNVVARQAALGSKRGHVSMVRKNMKNVGTHRVVRVEGSTIPSLVLDDLDLSPDLIWLDVEGMEADIVLGSLETICRSSPLVVCERPNDELHEVLSRVDYVQYATSSMDGLYRRK